VAAKKNGGKKRSGGKKGKKPAKRRNPSNPSTKQNPPRRRRRRNPDTGRGMVAVQAIGGTVVGAAGAATTEYLTAGTETFATPGMRAGLHAGIGTAALIPAIIWPKAAPALVGIGAPFFGLAGKLLGDVIMGGSAPSAKVPPPAKQAPGLGAVVIDNQAGRFGAVVVDPQQLGAGPVRMSARDLGAVVAEARNRR